jgi:hypothetical protein
VDRSAERVKPQVIFGAGSMGWLSVGPPSGALRIAWAKRSAHGISQRDRERKPVNLLVSRISPLPRRLLFTVGGRKARKGAKHNWPTALIDVVRCRHTTPYRRPIFARRNTVKLLFESNASALASALSIRHTLKVSSASRQKR